MQYNTKESSVKLAYEAQPRPRPIAAFSGETIVKVACGTNHTGSSQLHFNKFVYCCLSHLLNAFTFFFPGFQLQWIRMDMFTRKFHLSSFVWTCPFVQKLIYSFLCFDKQILGGDMAVMGGLYILFHILIFRSKLMDVSCTTLASPCSFCVLTRININMLIFVCNRLGHREQKDEFSPRRVDVFTRQNVLPPDAVISAGSASSACTAGMICLVLFPFVLNSFLKSCPLHLYELLCIKMR